MFGTKPAIKHLGVSTNHMTDLSLYEYGDIHKEELQNILRQEALKMFGPNCPKKAIEPKTRVSLGLFHQLRGFSRKAFANSLGYFF